MNLQARNKSLARRDVDICATILSDVPPQLPLRQEYMSLGFEVVYNASGVGKKATQHEAKKAVEEFRAIETIKEFRKRRLFPKKFHQIKHTIKERKRIEKELALPHGLSYESYQAEMNKLEAGSQSSKSKSGMSSSELSEIDLNIRKKLWIRRRLFKRRNNKQSSKLQTGTDLTDHTHQPYLSTPAAPFTFPDFLIPMCDESDGSRVKNIQQNRTGRRDAEDGAKTCSGMFIPTVVHTPTTIDSKHTLPRVVTPQDSSDDDSTYASKIPAISTNPFDSASSDKSEDSGLNPLDDEMMFSDIHSEGFGPVSHRHQQKYHNQQSMIAMNSHMHPSFLSTGAGADKGFITNSTNWMGESSKNCFDNMAKEFCHLVVVEAQVVEGKDKQFKFDKPAISPVMSAFTDVSPEVYTPLGIHISTLDSKGKDDKHIRPHNRDPEGALPTSEWMSIGQHVCDSSAIDFLQAVVMDESGNNIRQVEDGSTEQKSQIEDSITHSRSYFLQRESELARKPDPPMVGDDGDSSMILDSEGLVLSAHQDHDPLPSQVQGPTMALNQTVESVTQSIQCQSDFNAFVAGAFSDYEKDNNMTPSFSKNEPDPPESNNMYLNITDHFIPSIHTAADMSNSALPW
jgi:hypothetical protein